MSSHEDRPDSTRRPLSTPPGVLKPGSGTPENAHPDHGGLPQPQSYPRFADQRPSQRRRRSGCLLPVLGLGGIVLALVILGLFLPPVSLWETIDEALNDGGDEANDKLVIDGLEFVEIDADAPRLQMAGLGLGSAPGDLADAYGVHVVALSPADYLAKNTPAQGWHCATDLPASHALASQVYSLTQTGTPPSALTLDVETLPEAAADPNALVLYGWDAGANAWQFLPAQFVPESGAMQARLDYVPRCVAVFRGAGSARAVDVTLSPADTAVPEVVAANARVFPGDLHPTSAGTLQGVMAPGVDASQGYAVLPLINNYEDPSVIETANVRRVLENPALRRQHARQIAAFITSASEGYAGAAIDYREVPADLRESFTAFVRDLANLLHGQNRSLTVVLPAPRGEPGAWDTGGYDWPAIGAVADDVVIRMPSDPRVFAEGGQAGAIMAWAGTQINRNKLLLGVCALSVEEQRDSAWMPVTLDRALSFAGGVEVSPAVGVQPGEPFEASLVPPEGVQVEFGYEDSVRMPVVRYRDADGSLLRAMWLLDPVALRYRLEQATAYNLKGVFVFDLAAPGVLPGLETELLAYRLNQPGATEPVDLSPEWIVRADETEIGRATAATGEPVAFDAPPEPAALTVEAQIAGVTLGSAAIQVAEVEPTVLPPVEFQPSAEESTEEPTEGEAPAPSGDLGAEGLALPTIDPAILAAGDPGDAFEAGGHIRTFGGPTVLAAGRMGLRWIRVEIAFGAGQQAADHQRTIENAQGNGFKVLFNVTGDPAEFAAAGLPGYAAQYAEFVGGLAALGADGIEVWRNMNRANVWPNSQIDPAAYTYLLAVSFEAIKTANPSALVITGGIAPTDAAGEAGRADNVWNDDIYLAALAEAGAGQYADCVGVRYVQGAVPPDATSGDPRGDSPIHYLPLVTDRAWNAFGGALPVCFTRLGYLSPEGYPPLPDEFAWAQTITAAQQGEWLAGAMSAARGATDGKVRLMAIWSIDAPTDDASSATAGYGIQRPDGACPACEALAPVLE